MIKRIGEHLAEKGLVTSEAVERALNIQSRTGSMLGQILQAEGIISSYKFYQELAEFRKIPFVNLEEYEIKRSALIPEEKDEYQEMQYIPFDVVEGVYHIATTNPSDALKAHLDKKFSKYKIFITSPFDILWTLQKRFDKEYCYDASEVLFENMPSSSSKFIFTSFISRTILAVLLVALAYKLTDNAFLVDFLFVMNLFFLSSIFSKVLFFTVGLLSKKQYNETPPLEVEDRELPVYSILVPLYLEKRRTINNLLGSIRALDYPRDKLDIKLIVEATDHETIASIKSLRPEYNFQIIRVPQNYPKTKPKACNYALPFCKGDYITIYDAEDMPQPQQLKMALAKFFSSDGTVSCVQSRLNYYNRDENILTKLFSIEYASWFDYMLYGLQKLRLPIPLGGTSNHFSMKTLKAVYAWDPYNVTEDADLGVRLSIAGLRTEVIDCLTLEEAPIKFRAWKNQRVRWIKGYFQTYIVHMRQPLKLLKNLGFTRFLGFFFFVGAPGLIYLSVPIVMTLTVISFTFDLDIPDWLVNFSYFNLAVTLTFNFLIGAYIIAKNKWLNMLDGALLFPVYWVLHCFASFSAVYELIKMPHHWNKTEHGVSKMVPDND
jgi:cellulose synthase/poly-beta-1,6-N-acetylglucosamine synthase-like glycosyltransferase